MKVEGKDIFNTQFKALYLKYAGELIFFARKFVDHSTAEDIVHDIFLKIWDSKSTIIVEKDIKNYLLSMVQNACLDHIKHLSVADTFYQKTIRQFQLDELKYYETSKDYPWDKEKMEMLHTSIEKLPPKRREVFKKVFFEERSHAEIAKEMNISVRTVETHIYKALKFLRENLTYIVAIMGL